ncbi:hypothetical protein CHRYSEOSP005_05430 [Chryseobacterium sp. Alg-005]|uniref:hypothetical protein n=1 Tax=Chryseobacterium sp. Alg-005 TaxID=3159516 RepID=UPI0035558CC1
MNKLIVWCFAILMSCVNTPSQTSQKSQNMQTNAEILVSESQGGTGRPGFVILKNEQEFLKAVKGGSFTIGEVGKEPAGNYPDFPENKKVILYNLGEFRSGDHKITEIKSVSVKNNILYVEVPQSLSGGMEIQVISKPWMIFTVPSNYQFTAVELKYSK